MTMGTFSEILGEIVGFKWLKRIQYEFSRGCNFPSPSPETPFFHFCPQAKQHDLRFSTPHFFLS